MHKFFYLGIIGIILFEIANVYFIMPMPGSQEMNSIDAAYFLNHYKWIFRGLFMFGIAIGFKSAFSNRKWLAGFSLLLSAGLFYATNYQMAADTMFYPVQTLFMKAAADNKIDGSRLVIGVEQNGWAKAYPIQFLGYHHQVRDSLDGKPIMVTYCTVCRTGRVYVPIVQGKTEQFRLVGMDHFNAMFEDEGTKSWWRQATGEAAAGPLKGQALPEMPSTQTTLEKWLELHPNSLVMQPDPVFQVEYDSMSTYEGGRLRGTLTVYDSLSWKKKSWVAGILVGDKSKAYDWNELRQKRIILDEVNHQPVAVLLAKDGKSLFAFIRHAPEQQLLLSNDTLSDGQSRYNLLGKSLDSRFPDLKKLNVYQEYWHSWQTFHPNGE